MKIKEIESSKNKHLKWIKRLQSQSKQRDKEGLYVTEGEKQVLECIEEIPQRIHTLVIDEHVDIPVFEHEGIEVLRVKTDIFKNLSLDKTPQGYMAVVAMERTELSREVLNPNGIYIVLESIQDPGNMGTIIRVCDAVKADGIIYNKACVDIYHPKVVKSTVGSLERVPCYLVEHLTDGIRLCQSVGIQVYGAYLSESEWHFQKNYSRGTAFVIGNEGQGISDKVIECVDARVKIPMLGGAESLNAGVASSVLLYEAIRQRLHLYEEEALTMESES